MTLDDFRRKDCAYVISWSTSRTRRSKGRSVGEVIEEKEEGSAVN